ncbi:MAG TPA: hypothetical protein EYP55_07675, partial [Anaerolineae bacterium]|nr:hypothetical protein [Anaerolineae bacterium]
MIRPFSLRDVLLIKQLQGDGVQLDVEGAILKPHTPLMAALAVHLPFDDIGASTYVLDAVERGQRVRGFTQARWRRNGVEGDVVYIAPALAKDDEAPTAWQRLLTYLCQMEGGRGMQRLFAKLPEEAEEEIEIFRRVGFGVYTQEHVFRLDSRPAEVPPRGAIPLRPRRTEDEWGLNRLYCQAAPRLVQQTEGLGEGSWDSSPVGWWRGGRDERYVWEVGGEIVGYLRLIGGRKGHWLKALLHRDAQDRAEEFLRWGLALLAEYPPRPVYCSVRGYEAGLQWALKRVGFQPHVTLFLLVKHTTAWAREPERRRVPTLERGVEAAPTASRARAVKREITPHASRFTFHA